MVDLLFINYDDLRRDFHSYIKKISDRIQGELGMRFGDLGPVSFNEHRSVSGLGDAWLDGLSSSRISRSLVAKVPFSLRRNLANLVGTRIHDEIEHSVLDSYEALPSLKASMDEYQSVVSEHQLFS